MKTAIGYLGIDVAKTFHIVCIKDARKHSLTPSLRISDDREGYEQLRHCMDTLKDKYRIHLFVTGVESTGPYHRKLVAVLRQWNDVALTLLNPLQTAHYLKSDLRRASTDKISAEGIAQYLAEKNPTSTQFVSDACDTVKHIIQHLNGLSKQKSAAINRLHGQLVQIWPEYERTYKNLNTKQVLALLTVAQTPAQVNSLDFVAHKRLTIGGNQYTLRSDFITAVQELARSSQPRYVTLTLEPIIKSLAEEILFLLTQIEQLTSVLQGFFADSHHNDKPLLSTINGVGDVSAALFTATIGDVNRFRSGSQVVAFFGVNPGVKDSGDTIRGKRYIQKRGNSIVRYYLFNCVLAMIRMKNHPIQRFYQRLLNRGKSKMVALTACMHKLILIMYAMLKNNTPFSMNYT
jgi:transposase